MDRREFLSATAATALVGSSANAQPKGAATPAEAMKGPRERHLFVTCTYANTGIDSPDYVAVIDADPDSKSYSEVVQGLSMVEAGDELHHFGWNICAACHGKPGDRQYLVVPGLASNRIYVINAKDPTALRIHKVISPEVVKKTGFSAPHTVHCLPTGEIMISMLGDAKRDAPGGFLLLDDKFAIKGAWEADAKGMNFNYDFWYQPKHNVMLSSEWAAPKTFAGGPNFDDVKNGKYGRHVHLWNWKDKKIQKSFDLGAGSIPLEVRFLHDPNKPVGFVGAALSGAMWRVSADAKGEWTAEKAFELPPVKNEKFPGGAIPALVSDFVLSMDDKYMYVSAWLQGAVYQYDISDPAKPKLAGTVKLGGWGQKPAKLKEKELTGGPQMLQLSLDGRRLYVTNSLYSTWDDVFYPEIKKGGSWLVQIDCQPATGGMVLNKEFVIDFGKEQGGPSRAHEVRYPGGDCTSDIYS